MKISSQHWKQECHPQLVKKYNEKIDKYQNKVKKLNKKTNAKNYAVLFDVFILCHLSPFPRQLYALYLIFLTNSINQIFFCFSFYRYGYWYWSFSNGVNRFSSYQRCHRFPTVEKWIILISIKISCKSSLNAKKWNLRNKIWQSYIEIDPIERDRFQLWI